MATAKLRLKTSTRKDDTSNIQIEIQQNQKQARIPTKFYVNKNYWDKDRIKKSCTSVDNVKRANNELQAKLVKARQIIEDLEESGRIYTMNVKEIRDYIKIGKNANEDLRFLEYFKKHIEKYSKKNTKNKYLTTYAAISAYWSPGVYWEEINKQELNRFKMYRLRGASGATVNIDLRNIRTVFNAAIDDGVIGQGLYPFRRFEFCQTEARHHLNLSTDQLGAISTYQSDKGSVNDARDFFMLSFYLIGINNSDIYDIVTIKNDRLIYTRNKTGKEFNVKVEPEAWEIINRHRGKQSFLDWTERFASHNSLTQAINKKLKIIKKDLNLQELVMYSARHSWAGIAECTPISAEYSIIAQALGHSSDKGATGFYTQRQNDKVDKLNRKVIDQIFTED